MFDSENGIVVHPNKDFQPTENEVSQTVQNTAVTAQESSESIVGIKGSVDEAVKAIEQVAITANNQLKSAQKLNEMIQKFTI